jgi:hypothetical protein
MEESAKEPDRDGGLGSKARAPRPNPITQGGVSQPSISPYSSLHDVGNSFPFLRGQDVALGPGVAEGQGTGAVRSTRFSEPAKRRARPDTLPHPSVSGKRGCRVPRRCLRGRLCRLEKEKALQRKDRKRRSINLRRLRKCVSAARTGRCGRKLGKMGARRGEVAL